MEWRARLESEGPHGGWSSSNGQGVAAAGVRARMVALELVGRKEVLR